MICDAIHCVDRARVLFAIYPAGEKGPRVIAEISEDALRDIFGAQGGGDTLIAACRDHFDLIDGAALLHYRHAPEKPVMLGSGDFALPASFAKDFAY